MKEIFQKLAIKLIDDIGKAFWKKTVLDIIRLEGTVRFSAIYVDERDNTHDVEVNFGFWGARLVHKLYSITQNEPPVHTNWNRALFILFPDGKMEIEYIWDQELQDEVDKYNDESQLEIYLKNNSEWFDTIFNSSF